MLGTRWVLLGGSFGSGKSSVARLLGARGARVVHADEIGHQVLEPEGEAFSEVARRWPQTVLEGQIDRRRLGQVVFADRGQLAELERLTHPPIRDRIRRLVAQASESLVVVELPIPGDFLGPGWVKAAVVTTTRLRHERLTGLGWSLEEIKARLACQPSDADWRSSADYVINNQGSLTELGQVVDEFLAWLDTKPPSIH